MTIAAGKQLGPYEILSAIGAGGMGEVYKARDTRLDRIVAIKVLPPHFADRPELRDRFEREARTIANLKHPHICVLYDIGHQNGTHYLVMEYLEGETLAQRLKRGPLPLDQVLQYAIEIADALDTAHRQHFTHRDIKPANIMLTKTAGTKLLDFGLAKLKQKVNPAIPPDERPTNMGLTAEGTILGTLQYMAPEQVEGRTNDIDGRTDIFAFGAVVYEMATGKKCFEGKSQASVMAAILEREVPPMSSLQPMTPASLDRVVKRCLAKDRDKRWQTATDLCNELQWIKEGGGQATLPASALAKGWRQPIPLHLAGVIAVILAIVASVAVWKLKPTPLPTAQAPAHLTIALPPGDQLGSLNLPSVAFSPDGSLLAYVGTRGGTSQLYVRALDSLETKPIPGTEGASMPFFSPDGQWIGFFAQGKLKKVSVAGTSLQTLCDSPGGRGGSWEPDDTIFFAPTINSGLWKVSASGGKPQEVTILNRSKGEISHRWPQALPGGKALLFTVSTGTGWDESQIVAEMLETGERRVLVQGGTTGRYAPPGQLVYFRPGTLLALPFDLPHLEVTGSVPVTIAEGVMMAGAAVFGAHYAPSSMGSLAYIPAPPHEFELRLVWVDRKGMVQPIPSPPRSYRTLTLSPDGRQVVFEILSNSDDVWILDVARGATTRFTTEGGGSQYPVWTPDGKRIIYQGARAGFRNLFWKAADGTGSEEQLTTGEEFQISGSVSPDGRFLAFSSQNPTTGYDIWVLPLEGDPSTGSLRLRSGQALKPQVFLKTPSIEQSPMFSPDGRWLVYQSNESGRSEVYVQPFPGPGGKRQVSTEGGDNARWARNGRELFYRNGDKMMAVEITTSPTFSAGQPRVLFEGRFAAGYDVSPDGQRFLMVQAVEPEQPATQINVVLNWFEELKQKVPVGK